MARQIASHRRHQVVMAPGRTLPSGGWPTALLVVRAIVVLALAIALVLAAGTGLLPALRPDGRQLYSRHCAECHGAQGGRIPAVPLDSPAYVAGLGADGLGSAILAGTGMMPALGRAHGGPLADAEVRALVAYLMAAERFEAAGHQVYQSYCVACHGAGGHRIPAAPLGSVQFVSLRRDRELIDAVARGTLAMPAFGRAQGGPLADAEIAAVVRYLRVLAAGTSPARPVVAEQTRAASLFTRQCATCHMSQPLPRLDAASARVVITEGRSATGMPAFGGRLADEEIELLAQYLSDGLGNASHSAGWITSHPDFVQENSSRLCTACHQPSFCVTCHADR